MHISLQYPHPSPLPHSSLGSRCVASPIPSPPVVSPSGVRVFSRFQGGTKVFRRPSWRRCTPKYHLLLLLICGACPSSRLPATANEVGSGRHQNLFLRARGYANDIYPYSRGLRPYLQPILGAQLGRRTCTGAADSLLSSGEPMRLSIMHCKRESPRMRTLSKKKPACSAPRQLEKRELANGTQVDSVVAGLECPRPLPR